MKKFAKYILMLLAAGCVACTESGEDEGLGEGEQDPTPAVFNTFESFFIQNSYNKEAMLGTMPKPTLGEGKIEICTPMIIDRTALVATFKTDGGKVYVGDVEQISSQTPNDFTNPVTYRVVSETGHATEWVVSVTNTGLPIIVINTPNGATIPPKTEDWLENTQITIYNADLTIDYQEVVNIRGRGNSTWNAPKKPYAIKLNNKASLLGMPAHKRWVLLANWLDKTMLRNRVAFEIAEQTDLAWTPRSEFVEVVLNGVHKGNYLFCEQIKVDRNRVNIAEPSDDNPSGGYILELDTYFDEVFKFHSPHYNMPYMFKDPDEVTDVQYNYLFDYIENFEASLVDDERFAAREYVNYIDVDSFIDWWFVHELTSNPEPHHPKSSYLYKDVDGKLTAGPVWDFDWETFVTYSTNTWCIKESIYYGRLFQDEAFVARVKERWELLKPRFESVTDFILSEAARLTRSANINEPMWPITWVVNQDEKLSYSLATTRMRNNYSAKLHWMDRTISSW
ncbi:MAG: CotH kinase family protein [Tidjanibacter sp.]|nr:CotH kinase family protein [Tidjanibacter sp.]